MRYGGVVRIDAYLVTRGLARSRGHAKELVEAGMVSLDGAAVTKPSVTVADGARVAVAEHDRYVGRAAFKLLAALIAFGPDLTGRIAGARCLDLGASTGGFTQVLLAHGAAQVTALDVGHGQLVREVADDPRVVERSGLNVREVRADDLGDRFDLVVGDLSFISLRLVVGVLADQLRPGGRAMMLVKPQFEVGRGSLSKGGIVRSRALRQDALERVCRDAWKHGLEPLAAAVCPIRGANGNIEYLVLWKHRSGAGHDAVGARPSADEASTPPRGDSDIGPLIDELIASLDEGAP